MIYLNISFDGSILESVLIPPETFQMPDRKEVIERLSDQLLVKHPRGCITFLTGITSKSNTFTDAQLNHSIPHNGKLRNIINQKISEWSMAQCAAV